VKRYCTPNAVLTFLEYLEDYATPATLKLGLERIQAELVDMEDSPMKTTLLQRMDKIRAGERDLYF
jgi:2-iminoacetate synthase